MSQTDSNAGQQGPAGPSVERAHVALEVEFESAADAVRAYSENVGVGQLALATRDTLPKGVELTVKVRVPAWTVPLVATGKVTWSRADAMGLALTDLKPGEGLRLRQLMLDHTSRLDRVKRQFTRLLEQPVPAKVTSRWTTLVRLQDEMLTDAVSELLNEGSVVATSEPRSGSQPNLIVAEVATAAQVLDSFTRVPVVMVNVSGPNELALSRLPFIPAKAFVPQPATPAKIVQAVAQVIRGR